ncbi:hypothetical protein A5N81_23385 [Pseudomonas aeruginosa]|nr:hypothetical protein A5N81_23385 [Pseudomonas aeruginosa]
MTQPSKRNGQVPLDDALERHRDALKDLFPLPPSRPKSRKASKAAGVALLLALAIGALAWTLERGRVEVGTSATAQAPVVLLPGQQVDAIGGQLMPLAKVDAATAMAWKDDRLVFERTPLGEAVALLRHYRKAPILLDDPSLASLRLTGVFAAHNVDRLLDLLPSILPVAVSRQEDGSVEIQRKSTRK